MPQAAIGPKAARPQVSCYFWLPGFRRVDLPRFERVRACKWAPVNTELRQFLNLARFSVGVGGSNLHTPGIEKRMLSAPDLVTKSNGLSSNPQVESQFNVTKITLPPARFIDYYALSSDYYASGSNLT
jgi:hypothetical protein